MYKLGLGKALLNGAGIGSKAEGSMLVSQELIGNRRVSPRAFTSTASRRHGGPGATASLIAAGLKSQLIVAELACGLENASAKIGAPQTHASWQIST
jgi:hypothetical protein